ncbi:hypothetical protein K3495_g5041 [Podosphaera aphanis]|nr:hypothetical protein K3495_g5041 [Podosphaera aphanis]
MNDRTYLTPRSLDDLSTCDNEQIITPGNTNHGENLSDESIRLWSSEMELDNQEDTNVEEISAVTAARADEITCHLDEAKILPDTERRPRKAPRRDMYALAGSFEAYYTTMAATVSNPEIIGRKLYFVSSLKPPPNTWNQIDF